MSFFISDIFDKEAQKCDGARDKCDKGHGGPDSLSEILVNISKK